MSGSRVVVVGGGITGLAAAATLLDQARHDSRPLDLTVLEGGPEAGGHVRTTRVDGFVIEAGPNGFLNREPHTLALIQALGLTERLVTVRTEARRRYILHGGRLCPVPGNPATLVTSPALSWRAKLRLLGEPFAPAAPAGEESVHAFTARRLGREAADVLVDTAVGGITAGDSRRLSAEAQFPRLVEMERSHGSLLRGMFARRPKEPGTPAGPTRLLSFDHGMGVLTTALAARLGASLRVNAAVRAVGRAADGWRVSLAGGEVVPADQVVLAVPARRAAGIVEGLDAALAATLASFEYAGLAVVALGYRVRDVPRALDGTGYLATSAERLATLGVAWESSLFPGRAPEGAVLMRVMLGGSRRPDLVDHSEADLASVARRELAPVLGVEAEPLVTVVYRWPAAIAQYTIGHHARRSSVASGVARHEGLSICGSSYDGVALNDAVKSGRLAAAKVGAELWGPARRADAGVPALSGVPG